MRLFLRNWKSFFSPDLAPCWLLVITDNSPDGEDTEPCTYTSDGTFTAMISATSFFETVNVTYDVLVQYPVTDEFTVGTNAPMDYPVTSCESVV